MAKLVTPRTSGIVGLHVWGGACAVDALTEIAQQHGLRLLFDASHAFGCSYHGRLIGHFGDAVVLNFQDIKFFNTFEGGAIVTNDDQLLTYDEGERQHYHYVVLEIDHAVTHVSRDQLLHILWAENVLAG